jgi:hypothetical protein
MGWFNRLLGSGTSLGQKKVQKSPQKRRATLLLEGLEERLVPTITVPPPGTTGAAVITGTPGNDSLLIQMAPGNPSVLQLSDNGGATFTSTTIANLTSVQVFGLAGNDTFTINNGNGLVGTSFSLPIIFTGGPGPDTLALTGVPGGPAITETYNTGAATGTGTVINNNSIINQTISFVGVSQIVDLTPANQLIINTTNVSNYVQIINGGVFSGIRTTRVQGIDRSDVGDTPDDSNDPSLTNEDTFSDIQNQAFTPMDAGNKVNLIINGGTGTNNFTLNNPTTASNLATMTINGGNGGNNLGMQRRVPPGVVLSSSNFLRIDTSAPAIFIDQLYGLRLYRIPSVSEVAFWQNILNSSGAQAVASGIERSAESRTILVNLWYFRYLGRFPNGNEAQIWVNSLLAGNTEENVLQNILGSQEFFNRSQTFFSTGTPNERFVQTLYLLLLNRTASSTEVANWVNILNTTSRAQVSLSFLRSAEFRTDLFTDFYLSILHRPPDAGGLNMWVTSGSDFTTVRLAFLGSTEFINNG